ncbi:hypothetical protein BsWGS_14561 [Bradybaena similaris]
MQSRSQHVSKVITRITESAVLPYYLFVSVYMVVYWPFCPHPPESAIAAILKIVPIWYLTLYAYRHRVPNLDAHRHRVPNLDAHRHRVPNLGVWPSPAACPASLDSTSQEATDIDQHRPGVGKLQLGYFIPSLVVSSVGDICLVYKSLFKPGIFFFAIAQLLNLLALKKLYQRSSKAWVSVPLCVLLYTVILPGIHDSLFQVIVFLYAILIHSMLFFAIAGYESVPCSSTLSSMLGASLFVLSDFLIAYNKWLAETPHSQVSILLTYYVAQLLLAVSHC